MTIPSQFPQELLFTICAHVYSHCLPALPPSLDPFIAHDGGIPTSLPSSFPPGTWAEPLTRRTLANLCLVNHAWYEAAKPWLWRKVEVRLPGGWISLVEEVACDEEEPNLELVFGASLKTAESGSSSIGVNAASSSSVIPKEDELHQRLASITLQTQDNNSEVVVDPLTVTEPDSSVPLELLSPQVSRDPSPRRLRAKSKSPARWKILKSITDAIHNVMENGSPNVYVPLPHDPRPGRFIQHFDFNHFRTIGMRRSVEEGVKFRFVTGERVEAVLKEMPNLTSFGATEYMDGALNLPVLKELFLRGAPSRSRGRRSRGCGLMSESEDEDRERRMEYRDLEAIDLTGCVSAVFVNALTEFVSTYILPPSSSDAESRSEDANTSTSTSEGSSRRMMKEDALTCPGLQRLGLRGVKSILSDTLSAFVLSFPSLTHLDLSGTRVCPELLSSLGKSSTIRLRSLALARCIRLTSESIRSFLVNSPVTSQITELNLYGDMTFSSPLTKAHLADIVSLAPCFVSGELVYLDLSSSPVSQDLLANVCKPLPKLRSFGISYIPDLPLKTIADFILTKAPNVEILTMVSTTPELDCGQRTIPGIPRGSPRASSSALHMHIIRPLCTAPFSLSLSFPSASDEPPALPPTRLRVIELSTVMLGGLGAGAGTWKIVRSKGGRGWYVDTASTWVAQGAGESVLRRDLPPDHPFRVEMGRLAEASGNVSSGVGWHARKMEILHGHGMLGREDGLYGAVSFAYQG